MVSVFLVLFNMSLRQQWGDFSVENDCVWGGKSRQMHRCELTVLLLTQDLHCLVCALSSSYLLLPHPLLSLHTPPNPRLFASP